MDTNEFWILNANLPPESAAEVIYERLVDLNPENIIEYKRLFDQHFAKAYRWDLWGAAYLIDGGCSDDGFIDFRYGLISRGRSIFEDALSNADSLAGFASDSDDGYIPDDDCGYAAARAYKEVAGTEMPQQKYEHPDEPTGEDWDFDDPELCNQKLPKLWGKFGEP